MQFSLTLLTLPLLALASPYNHTHHNNNTHHEPEHNLETRQFSGSQLLNISALTQCISGVKTETCAKAVEECILVAISQL